MKTSKKLLLFTIFTIAFKIGLAFIPQGLSQNVWIILNVFSIIFYFLNFFFLYKYLKNSDLIQLRKLPITLLGIWAFLSLADYFVPYQQIKSNFEFTAYQAYLFVTLPYLTKTIVNIAGEISFGKGVLKSNKKLGLAIMISTILNFVVPLLIGWLAVNHPSNYYGYFLLTLGLLPALSMCVFYAFEKN